MKYLVFIVAILFFGGIFVSCSEETPLAPDLEEKDPIFQQRPTTLMPLNTENSWTYDEIRIANGDTTGNGSGDLSVVSAIGQSVKLQSQLSVITFELAKNASEGLYLYDYAPDMKKLRREYFFPYPVKIGSDHKYSFNGHDIKVRLDEEKVKAGIFNCYTYTYHFSDDDFPYTEKFSFCPKTGLIRYERKDTAQNQAVLDLVAYDVNGM